MAGESQRGGVFAPVRSELNFPDDEAKVLAFWKARHVFEKTLRADTRATGPSRGNYVFYEGPPTANGKPGIHHLIAGHVKDFD